MNKAKPENQMICWRQQECDHDSDLDCVAWISIACFSQVPIKLLKSMQQILHLLQLNLCKKRDVMALLRGDPAPDRLPDRNPLALL